MKLYRTPDDLVVEKSNKWYSIGRRSFDEIINQPDMHARLASLISSSAPMDLPPHELLAPIGTQEVWASGVTYFRSRNARMEESKDVGGGDFYDRVYSAERPELFFKSVPQKVVGHRAPVRIRRDATWSVPEPELTLLINSKAEIIGYTVGNDMSSRDIEGLNPLYLPQAKVYDGSCALGPGVLLQEQPLAQSTEIRLDIRRAGQQVFLGNARISEIVRKFEQLVEYLFRDHTFPSGCFLLTGTGIVPPDSFTLQGGDEIRISIEGIGELINEVAAV